MAEAPDTAGVIAPPPLIALGALLLGLGLHFIAPSSTVAVIPDWLRYFLALALIGLAAALLLLARGAFTRAGTPVQPWRPSAALVTSDVFAHVRNPMYLGGGLLLLGIALLIAADWLIVTTIACMAIIHYGVVLREERYLEKKFGAAYLDYKKAVPRYGWRT